MSNTFPLAFPCDFPIKVMGQRAADFQRLVTGIVRRHAPDLDEGRLRIQESRNRRYQSITLTISATSRAQLDAIYRDLSGHERVMMVL